MNYVPLLYCILCIMVLIYHTVAHFRWFSKQPQYTYQITIITIITIITGSLIIIVQISGHHLVVVNGEVAFDEVNEFLNRVK